MPVHQQRLPPHLIVLLVDDLGWHNVGFRNPQQHSPNLDELARSGAQLARHYTYRWCSPSRSAFLSGRLPIHVNEANAPNITSPGGIDVRMTLLPQKLKQGGYQTAAYGKWHVGARFRENLPSHRGFDEVTARNASTSHNTPRARPRPVHTFLLFSFITSCMQRSIDATPCLLAVLVVHAVLRLPRRFAGSLQQRGLLGGSRRA